MSIGEQKNAGQEQKVGPHEQKNGSASGHTWVRDARPVASSLSRTPYRRYLCDNCGEGFMHYYTVCPGMAAAERAYGCTSRCPQL
jgi:hypothetical protein